MGEIVVRRAAVGDEGAVGALFERYCAFYERHAAPERAREFVGARMRDGDSVIFVAEVSDGEGGRAVAGFLQLYPKWSSTTMTREWIFNDLYVEARFRRRGIGRGLMEAGAAFVRAEGASEATLKTQVENVAGQRLYEALGWVRERDFYTYRLGV